MMAAIAASSHGTVTATLATGCRTGIRFLEQESD